jgi:hypothetical protein
LCATNTIAAALREYRPADRASLAPLPSATTTSGGLTWDSQRCRRARQPARLPTRLVRRVKRVARAARRNDGGVGATGTGTRLLLCGGFHGATTSLLKMQCRGMLLSRFFSRRPPCASGERHHGQHPPFDRHQFVFKPVQAKDIFWRPAARHVTAREFSGGSFVRCDCTRIARKLVCY